MIVCELIAQLSQVKDQTKQVVLDGCGAPCIGINQEAEDNNGAEVYIAFNFGGLL